MVTKNSRTIEDTTSRKNGLKMSMVSSKLLDRETTVMERRPLKPMSVKSKMGLKNTKSKKMSLMT